MKSIFFPIVLSTVCLLPVAAGAATLVSDNFSSNNPLAGGSPWSFGIGSNNTTATSNANQFEWNAAGSPAGLTVLLNSSAPTARLDQPLGTTLSDTSSFVVTANFSLNVRSAPGDQDMQIAFGLTNSSLTGGDRTGSNSNFSSDNTFDTVEFNYFPNVSPEFFGPTLTPSVFGGQEPDSDAFSNFTSIFGDSSNLGTHTSGITGLDNNTEYQAQLAYDGTAQEATLAMYQVTAAGLVLLDTELTPLDLNAFGSGYDPTNPFEVNTLSIMAYNDGFTTTDEPSLVANMTYQSISVVSTPEPSSLALTLIAGLCAAAAARRKFRGELG